jgi:hypothetical protein
VVHALTVDDAVTVEEKREISQATRSASTR